ncbi:hypothetical protein [Butyrivibrio sp. AE2032]|uniref:hypothetical protein n=1 Tax=Butyrivibrio sp. AE2032 TaxID=1458463 RepID=UPI00055168FF|nr:hypothetical protein [Butyrivibrio sp. AE2032]
MNEHADAIKAYIDDLLNRVIESTLAHGGKEILDSVILTGSLGRNEPSIEVDDQGNITLLSDVEIAFVHSGKTEKLFHLIDAVCGEFEEDLNIFPVTVSRVKYAANFNLSFSSPKYKTLFTFDLFNGSRTIWGTDYLLGRKVSIAECDVFEAKRLVANRIGELIYLSSHDKKELLQMQWKGKVMLAIASAYLLLDQRYVSSYHGQRDRILESKAEVDNIIGDGFTDMYCKTFDFLRESGDPYSIQDEDLRRYVKNVGLLFEKKNIKRSRVNSLSRKAKYVVKYLKTGCHYGITGFENAILDSLIHDFADNDDKVIIDAETWKKVLY